MGKIEVNSYLFTMMAIGAIVFWGVVAVFIGDILWWIVRAEVMQIHARIANWRDRNKV